MIKIFAENNSERLSYAVDLVLNQVAQIPYEMVSDESLLKEEDVIINYSGRKLSVRSLSIHPFGLLFEKDIRVTDVPFEYRQDDFLVSIFPTEFDDLGFDLFSASFYIASRYEEYRNIEEHTDEHGRYLPQYSLQHKIGILKRPIINLWVKALLELLNTKMRTTFALPKSYTPVVSIDVDQAWQYKHKGIVKSAGSLVKSVVQGKFGVFNDKCSVMMGRKKDAFDTYDYISSFIAQQEVSGLFFFLIGDYQKPYDTNVSLNKLALRSLVKTLSEQFEVGIHPSYHSFLNEKELKKEVDKLGQAAGSSILKSRNHFLKISIPDSYRLLEKLNIEEDYTMGYAQEEGFRAGICTPFLLFDVLQNRPLKVKVHPFAYMDGTLNEYKKLPLEDAKKSVAFLKNQVKAVNGEMIAIWHNSSLTDTGIWKGWRSVFEETYH